MSLLRSRSLSLSLAAASLFVATQASAITVGWNYVNGFNDGGGQASLASGDLAGAPGFAQTNWNNHVGVGQGPGTIPFSLVDGTGAASGVSVTNWTQSSNNSWHLGDHASPNAKLLDGFANQQAAITFGGLGSQFTTGGYAVVVYYSNNEGPTNSTLSLTGGVNDAKSRAIRTGNTAQSSYSSVGFVQATDVLSNTTSTNYTVFYGLNDPSFTVAMTGGGNNGIAGVQIVTGVTPPPAGDSIGLNFAGANNNPGGRKVLTPSMLAGAPGFEQVNWNNTPGTAQTGTPSSANDTLLNLADNSGFATTLDVTFTSPQTWGNNFGANPTPDQIINGNGITDGTPTVNVSQIPFSQYDVVVYIGMYPPGRNSTYTINDGQTSMSIFATAPDWALFNTTGWDQVNPNATTSALRDTGNFIVFSGLTGSSFSLTSTGGGGINAIQIVNAAVALPEPMALTVLALSAFALPRRTRRA